MIYNFDELEFKILAVDEFCHTNGSFNVNGRPYSALSLRTEGEGLFTVGEKSFVSKPGDVMFIPHNTPYEVKYTNSKSIVFHFASCNYTETENVTLNSPMSIRIAFENAMKEWKDRFCVFSTKSDVYDILQKIADEKTPRATCDKIFDRCIEYIRENFCLPSLSLNEVCKKFFISEPTLRRKFQKYYNVSFIEFVQRLRFDKAFYLLSTSSDTIASIAYACGFEDEKYFSRAIKKKFGVPPSALMH